jgi:hypothetical protein
MGVSDKYLALHYHFEEIERSDEKKAVRSYYFKDYSQT